MTENFSHDDLLRLLDQVFDGTAGAAEYAQLNTLLAADADARRVYREYVLLHGNLKWQRLHDAVEAEEDLAFADVQPASLAPLPNFWRAPLQHLTLPIGFSLLAATVTIVSFLLTTAQIRLGSRADVPPPAAPAEMPIVARLTSTTDCQWSENTTPQHAGLRVGQELDLLAGAAELRFAGGARLVVQGPSRLQILARGQARLHAGAVAASIAERARGFILSMPHAEVIDLGTEFSVAVDAQGAAEVHVLSGEVLLQPHNLSQAQETRITAGEARLVQRDQPVRPIAFSSRRFTTAKLARSLTPYARHNSETALLAHFEENPCRAADDLLLSSKAPLTPETAVPGLGAATGPILSLDQTWKSEPLSAEQVACLSSQQFTLEAWVRNPTAVVPLGSDGFFSIFQYRLHPPSPPSGLLFAIAADHRLLLFLQSQPHGATHRVAQARPALFQHNQWNHVAVTYERDANDKHSTIQFFKTPLRDIANGARLAQRLTRQPLLQPFEPGASVVVGGGESPNRVFGGEIDEFRYTNRVLTGAEMPQLAAPDQTDSEDDSD